MLELIQTINNKIYKLFFLIFYSKSFNKFGSNSTLRFPFEINGAKFISIGNKVHIQTNAWFLALKNKNVIPSLIIEDNVYVGRGFHVVCIKDIKIKENVLISDNVYISDNLHEYKNINFPIKEQEVIFKNNVIIGENTWLGENVCVIGAQVGRHCVIGANSVVLSDIPDYSVAVGSPAKVVKQFNQKTNKWERL
tara:strand:+ start:435 stop:1016 length:582 start_codon:yes stop_codon:yes gene_type:complete